MSVERYYTKKPLIGWAITSLLAPLTAWTLLILVKRHRLGIHLDEVGVRDRTLPFMDRSIRWEDIKNVTLIPQSSGNSLIRLTVAVPTKKGLRTITLAPSLLHVGAEELYEVLKSRQRRKRSDSRGRS